MTTGTLVQVLVSGLMMGFVYALVSIGLNLIYGVMEVVNFAHGAFLMIGMYTAYWVNVSIGLDPVLAAPISALIVGGLGALTYLLIIKKVLNESPTAQIFCTFGLMVFLESTALYFFSPDFRSVKDSMFSGTINFLGLNISEAKLVVSIGAILTTAVLFWLYNHTSIGRALRATAISHQAAKLMGIDTEKMFLLSWILGGATVGIAGALLASYYNIFPTVGMTFVLIAFTVVVLGGFGSIRGTLYAGLIIGLVENFAGIVNPSLKYAVVYAIFILVIVFRPKGLLGR